MAKDTKKKSSARVKLVWKNGAEANVLPENLQPWLDQGWVEQSASSADENPED